MLASSTDQNLHGLKNGEIVMDSPIGTARPDQPTGSHVRVLQGFNPNLKTFGWLAVGADTDNGNDINQQNRLQCPDGRGSRRKPADKSPETGTRGPHA
jgi:hypothetical protein